MTVVDTELRTDTLVWPTMTAIAECLCTELVASGLPPTCLCGVLPGEAIDASYVTSSEGMAWVRLANAFPYNAFPNASLSGNPCVMPLGFELEIGALWCAPVSRDSRGNPPRPEDQAATAEIQVAAMAAMHRAIVCCLPNERAQVAMGAYTPTGPEGGVVGGTWSLVVAENILPAITPTRRVGGGRR